MRSIFSIFLFLVSGFWLLVTELYADTVYTEDGKEVRGIVVEDYRDRIVLSTVDGEITLIKSNVKELYFDSEEDNLIKLAEQSRERKDYLKAFVYYDKALKLNPKSKAAMDGVVFLQGYLFRKEQVQKEEDVRKREAIENYGAVVPTMPTDEEKEKKAAETLKKTVGITITTESGLPVVDSVQLKSPAAEAGIKKGDKLIAVWARLTGYLSPAEVRDILLDKPSLELKITVERVFDVKLDWGNATGMSLSMEFYGLTVAGVKEYSPAFRAGIKKGDLITAIDGQSTKTDHGK
ncbi:MAG: PDZ domain-containing protein [Candidatus Omnitrophica bacterium]|nr:PDZ domain-containing protein [Candidatus Omnitrophota bacterium]